MTVLATKLTALTDLRMARTAIRASMLPQPEATRSLLVTSAAQRLETAANLLRGADTRRPMGGIIEAAEGAVAAISREGFGAQHEASVLTRRGIQLLRHEPDVSAHIRTRNEAIKAAFAHAAKSM